MRVRSRRRSILPSQTLVLPPRQLPSRKARQVREELAEAGKQIEEQQKGEEEMERLLASSNVRMPPQKLRSCILSFENVKGNDDYLRHSFLDFLLSSGKLSGKRWVNPQPKVCCERGKRQEERERCW